MKKSSFKKNALGIWEKDGNPYPHVCEVKTDSCLKAQLVRKVTYKPHTLVQYYPGTITREGTKKEGYIYFVSVIPAEANGCDGKMCPMPLCMLDLSKRQCDELIQNYNIPEKVFVKPAIASHALASFPTNVEEEAAEIEEELVTTNEILSDDAEIFIN